MRRHQRQRRLPDPADASNATNPGAIMHDLSQEFL
jgi:hypothetical protein